MKHKRKPHGILCWLKRCVSDISKLNITPEDYLLLSFLLEAGDAHGMDWPQKTEHTNF